MLSENISSVVRSFTLMVYILLDNVSTPKASFLLSGLMLSPETLKYLYSFAKVLTSNKTSSSVSKLLYFRV